MNKLLWQGEEIKKWFGYCKVYTNKDKPLYWYNFECEISTIHGMELIPAIKIEYDGVLFCIANHFGIGYHKLINGGWPNYRHFSLPVESFEESHKPAFNFHSFDLDAYSQHEAMREQWQKKNFPDEYEKFEKMRIQIKQLNIKE